MSREQGPAAFVDIKQLLLSATMLRKLMDTCKCLCCNCQIEDNDFLVPTNVMLPNRHNDELLKSATTFSSSSSRSTSKALKARWLPRTSHSPIAMMNCSTSPLSSVPHEHENIKCARKTRENDISYQLKVAHYSFWQEILGRR